MVGVTCVQIQAGQSVSNAVNLSMMRWCGVQMPAAWTAADVSFDVSYDNGTTWTALFTQTGEYTIPSAQAAASRTIALDVHITAGVPLVRVRSGLVAAPVVQAAMRQLCLIVRATGEV